MVRHSTPLATLAPSPYGLATDLFPWRRFSVGQIEWRGVRQKPQIMEHRPFGPHSSPCSVRNRLLAPPRRWCLERGNRKRQKMRQPRVVKAEDGNVRPAPRFNCAALVTLCGIAPVSRDVCCWRKTLGGKYGLYLADFAFESISLVWSQ